MIDRYSRPEMNHIFSQNNKYRIWTEIELLVCEAMFELGGYEISQTELELIRSNAGYDAAEIDNLEKTLNHDVLAFLTNLGEFVDGGAGSSAVGSAPTASDAAPAPTASDAAPAPVPAARAPVPAAPAPTASDAAPAPVPAAPAPVPAAPPGNLKPSRWLHYGMTSSDLTDTALCYQLTQAIDLIVTAVQALGKAAKQRAIEHQQTLAVGRTHGVHAEPMVFGMKFATWAWALKRAEQRLLDARHNIAVGAISGAVGSYSSIDPAIERYVCDKLGLTPDPLSTQIVSRDRHAQVATALALTASTLEQIALEVRSLQRTEILEAEEPFSTGQKGSSAMPHKRNPVVAERICGMARVIKANAQVALDNVALWHERDISHSSAERIAMVDSFLALDYMLDKALWLVEGLIVYPERCLENLNATRGLVYSSKVLLALIDTGMPRETAYEIVQEHSMTVWADIQVARSGAGLRELLDKDSRLELSAEVLDKVFDPWEFLTNTGMIFERLEQLEF